MEEKIGYKIMNQDMTCYGGNKPFQYEIGKTYECKGEIKFCENGFHFCKNIFNTLKYYCNFKGDRRFFKIQYDKCINSWDKSITNKITILEEINIFDFINESMSENDWYLISCNQKLPEDFIREFQDNVYWYWISEYQKLSYSFREEFKDRFN